MPNWPAGNCSPAATSAKDERGVTGFETLAASYDRTFDGTDIGARMRARTRARLDTAFRPGQRVLELNCGTGEDALHLARRGIQVIATDASPAMLGEARRKIAAAGLSERVETRLLPIETIGDIAASAPFDGAFSNFGGLNCVADLNRVAAVALLT